MSDPDLKDLLPEPFLTVRPGDQVTVFCNVIDAIGSDGEPESLAAELNRWAPEVTWIVVEGSGVAGVIHVARPESMLAPAPRNPNGSKTGKYGDDD